ncbi:TPA: EpsG family protein [Vibrio parahaemolyticus]
MNQRLYTSIFCNTVNAMALMTFPVIGLFLSLCSQALLYFNKKTSKINNIIIAFGFAILAFQYERLDGSGDIVKYEIAYNYISNEASLSQVFQDFYNIFYSGWNTVLYFTAKIFDNFNYVNFIFVLIYYKLLTSIVDKFANTKKELIYLLFFFILYLSLPFLFTTYRNQASFLVFFYGVLCCNRIARYALMIVSISLHPASIFLLLIYTLKNIVRVNVNFLPIILILGFLIKPIIQLFSGLLLHIPFVGGKIQTYIMGDWSNYDFSRASDLLQIINTAGIVFTVIFSFYILKRHRIARSDCISFILVYFATSLLFVSFQTFAQRYILFCFPLYIPVIISAFRVGSSLEKLVLTFLMILTIDVRFFTVFSNSSFVIGEGFPDNIIASTVNIFNLL